jgi:uncharacterized protein
MSQSTDFTSAAFARHLNEHRLMGVRSTSSGELFLPPHPLAPGESSCNMEWIEFRGRGTLEAFTIIHMAPTAMIKEGYGRENPYCTGIVRLDEGVAISGQIVGVDVHKPETIRIGTPVTVEYVDSGVGPEHKTRLAFRVVG